MKKKRKRKRRKKMKTKTKKIMMKVESSLTEGKQILF